MSTRTRSPSAEERAKRCKKPACVEFEFGAVGAGVALQAAAAVQPRPVLLLGVHGRLRLQRLRRPVQADAFEGRRHHDELHPLPRQRDQALLQSDQGGQAVALQGRGYA